MSTTSWRSIVSSIVAVGLFGANVIVAVDNVTETSIAKENVKLNQCSSWTAAEDLDHCMTFFGQCQDLPNECLECQCNSHCVYGIESSAHCKVPDSVECNGDRNVTIIRPFRCAYCYQSDDPICEENVSCDSVADPNNRFYVANCEVKPDLICLGGRHFPQQRPCNWTGGHRWLTALILSITLGGFGADRFVMLIYFFGFKNKNHFGQFQILFGTLARRHRKAVQLWRPRSLDSGGRGHDCHQICRTS